MKTGTGVSLLLTLLLLAGASHLSGLPALNKSASEAIIAGTVFRDPGFAFQRVEVVLTVLTPPSGTKPAKPRKVATDARGEFVFRVPAGASKYRVRASAEGYMAEEKTVDVNADERVDVYLTLKPESR